MRSILSALVCAFSAMVLSPSLNAQQSKVRFESVGNGGNCAGCGWILAEGEITAETPADFDKFFGPAVARETRYRPTLVLNSPGGNLIAGIELGQRIRRFGLNTEIGYSRKIDGYSYEIEPGVCASACAYAFVGGVSRSIDEMFAFTKKDGASSKFGVHRFFRKDALSNLDIKRYAARDLDQEQQLTSLIAVYLTSMGIDATLLGLAAEADANSMRWLTRTELESLRVVYNPSHFLPWAVEPYRNGAIAFTQSQDKGTTISLHCNRKKEIFVLVNSPDFEPDSASKIRNCPLGQESTAFGVKFSAENLTQGPITNNRSTLLIRLPAPPSGFDEKINLDVPRYCAVYFSTTKIRMPETIRLALRNCL